MRAARFDVSTKLLEDLLHLPDAARIIGAEKVSPIDGIVTFVVDDPNLPESGEPHDVIPTVYEHRTEWKWNVDDLR